MEARSARLSARMSISRTSIATDDGKVAEKQGVAKRRFSRAVNLVKFALRFDNQRPSISASETSHVSKPKIVMENTYRMEPDEPGKFRCSKVEMIVTDLFGAYLCDYTYDKSTAAAKTSLLCSMVKDRVKCLGYHRYKILCNVYMGENTGQGMQVASRALWNEKTDSHVSVRYDGDGWFVIGMVHGVYYE